MIRSFLAISLPAEVLDDLVAVRRSLEGLGLRGRGVGRRAIHLTLKFLGYVGRDCLEETSPALHALSDTIAPFDVVLNGVGAFPNPRRARVVVVTVRGCPGLQDLQGAVEERLEALGLPRERRQYRPHLTLMRLRPPCNLPRLQDWLAREPGVGGRSFPVTCFHLYESVLTPSGARYRVLENFRLGDSSKQT